LNSNDLRAYNNGGREMIHVKVASVEPHFAATDAPTGANLAGQRSSEQQGGAGAAREMRRRAVQPPTRMK
jgi:hypothetical protein